MPYGTLSDEEISVCPCDSQVFFYTGADSQDLCDPDGELTWQETFDDSLKRSWTFEKNGICGKPVISQEKENQR